MLIGDMRVSTDNAKKPAVWAWNPDLLLTHPARQGCGV